MINVNNAGIFARAVLACFLAGTLLSGCGNQAEPDTSLSASGGTRTASADPNASTDPSLAAKPSDAAAADTATGAVSTTATADSAQTDTSATGDPSAKGDASTASDPSADSASSEVADVESMVPTKSYPSAAARSKAPGAINDDVGDPEPDPMQDDGDNAGMAGAVDPLAVDSPGDTPRMPTEHSHWLKGSIFNAKVAVFLNSVKFGEFRSSVDKDITWKLRNGINVISFVYTPLVTTAAAHLDVIEGEHHPDIAPLASFRSVVLPKPADRTKPGDPVTQTYSFIAR